MPDVTFGTGPCEFGSAVNLQVWCWEEKVNARQVAVVLQAAQHSAIVAAVTCFSSVAVFTNPMLSVSV